MPIDSSIRKVMVIGSGPIVIGQAAEFDYAGAQACRVLHDAGVNVVLVNSNPATIMTDKALADGAVFERALDIDEAVGIDREHAVFHVLFHGGVDLGGVLRFLLGAKLGFGEDEVDGGHSALGVLAHAVPVRLIGRELVAGNDRPLFHMVCFGHQDISG